MQAFRVGIFLIFFISWICSYSQTSKDVENVKSPRSFKRTKKNEKKFLYIFPKKKKTAIEIFRENQIKVQKQNIKEAKILAKPQYSNPAYFGHKRPPKKRKLSKRKFCKVCKIVH